MNAYSIRVYDMEAGRLSNKLEVGLVTPPEAAVVLGEYHLATVDSEGLLSVYKLSDLTLLCTGYINNSGLCCISMIEDRGIVLLGYQTGEVDMLQMRNIVPPVPVSTVMRLWFPGQDGTPTHWDDQFTALCPSCGHRLAFNDEVLGESSEERRLTKLGTQVGCPKCNRLLKLNRFVVDNQGAWREVHTSSYFGPGAAESEAEQLDFEGGRDEGETDSLRETSEEVDQYHEAARRFVAEWRAGAYDEHLNALKRLLIPVPLCWLAASMGAALFIDGGWLNRITAAPGCGLFLAYPILCYQIFRFLVPGLTRKESGLTWLIMTVILITITLLAVTIRPIDRMWIHFLRIDLSLDFTTLIAKASLMTLTLAPVLLMIVSITSARQAGAKLRTPYKPWLLVGGLLFLLAVSPSFMSAAVLLLLEVVLSGLAVRSIIMSRGR